MRVYTCVGCAVGFGSRWRFIFISDLSLFLSFAYRQPENLLPSIFVAVFTILYALLVIKSRRVDRHEKEKTGHVFLHEDTGPGRQLYAVVVDTGFRSPAHCSAKVLASSGLWDRKNRFPSSRGREPQGSHTAGGKLGPGARRG